jgi:hypothetical protein
MQLVSSPARSATGEYQPDNSLGFATALRCVLFVVVSRLLQQSHSDEGAYTYGMDNAPARRYLLELRNQLLRER